jgi:hypothetical protein
MSNPNPDMSGLTPVKPGQVLNPNGKPKGTRNVSTVLRELLASQDPDGCYATPLCKKLLQLAYNKDDLNAIKEILDRIEGKVPNRNFVSGDPENPHGVTINVNKPIVDKSITQVVGTDTCIVQSPQVV